MPTVEVLSPERTSPRSIVLLPTLRDGLPSLSSLLASLVVSSSSFHTPSVLLSPSQSSSTATAPERSLMLSWSRSSVTTGISALVSSVSQIASSFVIRGLTSSVVQQLDLQKPQYLQTASYGHFGVYIYTYQSYCEADILFSFR